LVAVGTLLGAGIAVAGLSAASGSQATSRRVASVTSAAPCTSAGYALSATVTPRAGVAWPISVTGQVDFTTEAATASVTLPSSLPLAALAGATLHVELVAGTAYVEVPPTLAGLVGGAPWVSIALPADAGSWLTGLFGQLAGWCGNAQSLVAALGSDGGALSALGTSSVDNGSVRGTQVIPSGNAIARLLELPRSLPTGLFNPSRAPIDVWSDAHGALVRLSVGSSLTLDVTNIDQSVPISAPTGAVALPSSFLKMFGLA